MAAPPRGRIVGRCTFHTTSKACGPDYLPDLLLAICSRVATLSCRSSTVFLSHGNFAFLLHCNECEAHAIARVERKMRPELPRETKCEACNGTGFPKVKQPTKPGRRIYPAPCRKCGGKGRIKETD
jgi:hypothetical protein